MAALESAMGAALIVMVANLTLGRKRFAAVQTEVQDIRGRAERLRDRARQLVDEDSAAYGHVAAAMALPRGEEHERLERRAAVQEALKGAVAPPLETMRVAVHVLDLAAALVRLGNPSAVSDVGTAAVSARAGYEAARLNVEINLAAVDDAAWCESVRGELTAVPEAEDLAADVLAATEAIIRGEA